MFNVCEKCGMYNPAKTVLPADGSSTHYIAYAVCPTCGHQHTFKQLPLFIVCGASGTGKTTLLQQLSTEVTEYIPLEGDILWCPAFDNPDNHYRDFNDIWLRMAKNIGQSGHPVVVFSAGMGVPENLRNCVESRYFSNIYVLALVCNETILVERLRNRPTWRNCSEDFIQQQVSFNRWYIDVGPTLDDPLTILDTSDISIQNTLATFKSWILPILPQEEGYQ
jgi:hypothetical protein